MANIVILKGLRQNGDFEFEEQILHLIPYMEYSKLREKRRALLP